jgi:thiol-disulfide isomerase/thioredoxin
MHANRPIGTVLFLALTVALSACAGGGDTGASGPPRSAASSSARDEATAPPSDPPVGGASPSAAPPSTEGPAPSEAGQPAFDDPLLALELTDVRDGTTFTLGELAADGPVIVETMAIWCTNCRSQMREVTAAHDLAEFHSVSVDVEPTEIAEDLAAYSEREGFGWPFVMADASLATQLRERFGNAVLLPPGMPKLLIRTDGSVELLPLGQLLSAQQIAELVEG